MLFTLQGRVDSCGAGKLLYAVETIRLEDLCVQGTTPLTKPLMKHCETLLKLHITLVKHLKEFTKFNKTLVEHCKTLMKHCKTLLKHCKTS